MPPAVAPAAPTRSHTKQLTGLAIILNGYVHVARSNTDVAMACRLHDFVQRAATSQGMAYECVPAVMDCQVSQARFSETTTGGAKTLAQHVAA